MKKLLVTLSLLFIVTSSFCTNGSITKNYNFGRITSIEASSIFSIEVTQGNARGVRIECDEIYEKYLLVRCSEGELKLSLTPNTYIERNRHQKDQIGIKVYLQMPTIKELDLSGASSLQATGVFSTNELEIDLSGATSVTGLNISGNKLSLDCSGASSIDLTGDFREIEADISGASTIKLHSNATSVEADVSGASNFSVTGNHKRTDITASGASNVKLNGSTDYLKSIATGASNFKAQEYVAKNGYAEVTGASNSKVNCTGELRIMVGKTSKLTYYGNPTVIDMNKNSNVVKGD